MQPIASAALLQGVSTLNGKQENCADLPPATTSIIIIITPPKVGEVRCSLKMHNSDGMQLQLQANMMVIVANVMLISWKSKRGHPRNFNLLVTIGRLSGNIILLAS